MPPPPTLLRALVACSAAALAGCPDGIGPLPGQPVPDERVDVTALAGPDLVVVEGQRVLLSGQASRALGGDPVLSWSQLDGPPVLLTNPSSPAPAFTAPFAPATIVFQLRAEAEGAVAFDEVRVVVAGVPGPEPAFLEVPADATAQPSSQTSFDVDVRTPAIGGVTLTARASCDPGAAVAVSGTTVNVTLPATLPCIVVVDGVGADGRGLAPAARVFWPTGTALPRVTSAVLPAAVEPGADVRLAFGRDDTPGSAARAWAAGADPTVALVPSVDGAFIVSSPPRRERLVIGVERRLGGASGGVQYKLVTVTAGSGNIAPHASGGADRIVPPGARFRIDTSQSGDGDQDPITVDIRQVLGATATPDPAAIGVFTAPADAGDLLFHVVAFDGTVESAPDPVRVVVTATAANQPPVLVLPATRFVVPGQQFFLDASGAEDDSGFIKGATLLEDAADAAPLITGPVDMDPVTLVHALVAGAVGDVYHFTITVFDDDELIGTASQTVTVEQGGPYVDPVRGDDGGDGTAAAPFATIDGALGTAVRYELPELLLAEGTHAALVAALPERLSLRGQLTFDGADYVPGGGETILPAGDAGIVVVDAHLTSLTVRLDGTTGSVSLDGTSALDFARVVESAAHAAPLVVVDPSAAATVQRTSVEPAAPHADGAVVVQPAATARIVASTVDGSPDPGLTGDTAVGIACVGAVLALDGAQVTGAAAGATDGVGVSATLGCALDATATTIAGGAATLSATGIDASGSLVTLDGASVVEGASADASAGVAMSCAGLEGSALVHATLRAGALGTALDAAAGLDVVDASVSLDGASVSADGTLAASVVANGGVVLADGATLESSGDGVVVSSTNELSLVDTLVNAGARGIAVDTGEISLTGVAITAGTIGIDAAFADVIAADSDVTVASVGAADGIVAAGAAVRDCTVVVGGTTARAVVLGALSAIQRTSLRATASAGTATGLSHAGVLSLFSSYVDAAGDAQSAAVESAGALTMRHGTLVANGAALRLADGGSVDAANSALRGAPGIFATSDAPWTAAIALAFQAGGALVQTATRSASTQADLDALGCGACLSIDVGALVDGTGHLTAGPNALVDAGDTAQSLPTDIDGDARPQGPRPDIGCDERTP